MRWLLFPIVILIIGAQCSKIDQARQTALEEAAQKAVKSRLGEDAEAKEVSGSGVTVSRKGAEYTISFTGKNVTAGKRLPEKLPVFPGAVLVSHIQGVNEDTINMKTDVSLPEIERFYREALLMEGFSEENVMKTEEEFSGIWVRPGSDLNIHIYAFTEDGHSRIVMIVSRES